MNTLTHINPQTGSLNFSCLTRLTKEVQFYYLASFTTPYSITNLTLGQDFFQHPQIE